MKALVILGAGDGSLPTYVVAHRLGHHVIGVDQHDWEVAVPLADEFLHISTTEPEAIIAALGDRPDIAGILAPASDIALPTLQVLARRYGTAGLPPHVVRASTDKAYFHRLCEAAGLSSYRLVEGDSTGELLAESDRLRMPLVVKPIDSAGSRGISLCANRARLPGAIEAALSMSRRHTAVLEEHVEGSHHTLEAFFTDGQLAFAAITTRTITEPPHLVTTSHRVPSGLNEEIECRILDATRTACAMLGVRTGPIDVDVIVEPDGTVHLIEFGARVGGSGLTELIRHAYGVDVVEASINAAFGLPVDLQPLRERRCGTLSILRSDRDGVLAAVQGEDEVRQTPELAELSLVAAPGHEVNAYRYAAAKLGYAILVADSEAKLAEALATLRRRLTFTVADAVDHEPGRSSTTMSPEETRSRRVVRCLLLALGALASAAYVEVALPKQQEMANVWILLVHLVPFVFGTEFVASLRPQWFRRRRLPELIQVAAFVTVFCYFAPRMFDRFIASDFDSFYYLMLTLMPLLILTFALQYRVGGGRASTVRRGSYASILVMLSGAEDTMFWILRGRPIPEQWTWASHINVFFGHVVSRNTAFAFMGAHLVLAALVLFLPDRYFTALRWWRPSASRTETMPTEAMP